MANWMWVSPHQIRISAACAAAERIAQKSYASSGSFQVWIQPKILTEIRPKTVNRDAPDPCCELLCSEV